MHVHIYIYALRQARAALGDSQAQNLRIHEELRAKVRAAVSAAAERDQCAAELRKVTEELDETREAAAAAFAATMLRQAEHEAECENLRRDAAEKEHQLDVKDKEAVALFRRVVSAESTLSERAGTHTQQLAAAAAEAEEQARAHEGERVRVQAELAEALKQVGNAHGNKRARQHRQMHTKHARTHTHTHSHTHTRSWRTCKDATRRRKAVRQSWQARWRASGRQGKRRMSRYGDQGRL